MKQSAAKKLGVAALGAAFAVTAAGTASAAPSLPVGADALGTVTKALPLGAGLTELPVGAPESLGGGQGALDQGVKTLPATAGQATKSLPLDAVTGGLGGGALGGLLGGLPAGLPIG